MTERDAQNLLQFLGFYNGAIDGIWGPLSKDALLKFQTAYGGIVKNGILQEESQKAMRHAVCYGMPVFETDTNVGGTFWDGIKYWTREEFRCRCGGKYCSGFPAEPSETLVCLVDDVREHFGKPGHSSSGLRCRQHNAAVGGVDGSRHLSGKALDFCIEGESSADVLSYVQQHRATRYAYAINGTYVHVDVD